MKNEHIFKEIGKEWDDYLKNENKINKEKFEIEKYDLLDCYEEWKKKERMMRIPESYQTATKLLKKHRIPFLSEDEVNEFVENTEINKHLWGGIFISTVINELYKDREINLDVSDLNCLGCYNKNKKIVVKGDCGAGTGIEMKGGKIKIYGNFDPKEHISEYAEKGEIYHKEELVWKDGKFMGDSI